MTLGKKKLTFFQKLTLPSARSGHSTKHRTHRHTHLIHTHMHTYTHFVECRPPNTRQTWSLCRVFLPWHSANYHNLLSVRWSTLDKLNLTTAPPFTISLLCRVSERYSINSLPNVRQRTLSKASFAVFLPRALCRVLHSAKCLPSVLELCRMPGALGKAIYSSSDIVYLSNRFSKKGGNSPRVEDAAK